MRGSFGALVLRLRFGKAPTVRAWITVLAALFVAVMAAMLVVYLAPKPTGVTATGARTSKRAQSPKAQPKNYPPVLVPWPERPVESAERRPSAEVLATADMKAAPWSPGLALRGARMSARWEDSRALIEELSTRDVRSYAIGDLLPRGCLLVGVSTAAVDILVSDVELVRMELSGKLSSVVDFRAAYEARPLPKAQDLAPDYKLAVEEALEAVQTAPPAEVQAYINELLECGDPVIELLVPALDSPLKVTPGVYQFRDRTMRPVFVGDVVIGILEPLTGQTFGDPTEAKSAVERGRIVDSWRSWWGVE